MVTAVVLGAVSCQPKKEQQTENQSQEDTAKVTSTDSIIIGTSGDFGQSTFSLITEKGDTLELLRELPNGDLSKILGDIDSDQRYAITYEKEDGDLYLKSAVNLTQLETFTKDYQLVGATSMVYQKDTLNIEALNDSAVVAKSRTGKMVQLKK